MQLLSPRHDEIELLAYRLWQERGEPFGTPEVDWFEAENELKSAASSEDAPLAAVAKSIGAALGSVAALVSGKV